MRFVTLIFFSFLLFSFNNLSAAQDMVNAPETNETETQAAPEPQETENNSEDNGNVFARASDAQIEEAQKFYKKCKGNETLSARKDCKCAATSYLETRLRLGNSATIEQIIAENINSCLKDEDSMIEQPDRVKIEVTEVQMKEAESIYNWCKGNYDVSRELDCECLASEFLQKRVEEGPMIGRDIILGSLGGKCKNLVDTAGAQYQQCMSGAAVKKTYGIERKKFCECYARAWTKNYEAQTGKFNPRMKMSFGVIAIAQCKKPDAYR